MVSKGWSQMLAFFGFDLTARLMPVQTGVDAVDKADQHRKRFADSSNFVQKRLSVYVVNDVVVVKETSPRAV